MTYAWSSKKIIGIIFSLGLFWASAQAMDADLWQIPALPQGNIVWVDKAAEVNNINVNYTYLTSSLRAKEIIEFYQQALLRLGWKMTNYFPEPGIMSFQKEGRFLYVAVFGLSEASRVYILKSASDLRVCRLLVNFFFKPEIAPDAAGKDSPDVPRYPLSRRRLNIFTQRKGDFLLYETQATPQEVGNFYRRNLGAYGWEIVPNFNPELLGRFKEAREALKEVAILAFRRGEENLYITAYPMPKEIPGARTLIAVTRNFWKEFYPGGE